MKKGEIAGAMWTTLVNAYNQGGRTRVEIPYKDALDIIVCLAANVVSQVPSSIERDAMIREVAPKMSRLVDTVRRRSDIHLPSKPNLVI